MAEQICILEEGLNDLYKKKNANFFYVTNTIVNGNGEVIGYLDLVQICFNWNGVAAIL